MNIVRIILCVLVLGAGGFALGWLVFPQREPDRQPAPAKTDEAPAEVRSRFALSAADMTLDRERPSLAVVGDNVLLAWASQTSDEAYTLFLARSTDRGATFAAPTAWRTFDVQRFKSRMRDREVIRPSAVLPRLSVAGERITLGWTEPGPRQETLGDRPMRFLVAHSQDGGATFTEPVCMHGPAAVRPNFTGLFAAADGTTACTWLDRMQQPLCGILGEKAAVGTEELVYSPADGGKGICPCCDLDVARTPTGVNLVAFRHSLGGNRDIYLARGKDGAAFEKPVAVGPDHWAFDGCPHDGPSLALNGDRVHVAWMSAHSGHQQVYLADAAVADQTFTPRPLSPPSTGEQGHPRIVTAGKELHAVWDEGLSAPPAPVAGAKGHQHGTPLTGSGRAIVYAHSTDGGLTFTAPRQLAAKPGAFQVRPVAAVDATGTVHVAWSELTEAGKSIVYLRPAPEKASCCDKTPTGTSTDEHTR